MDRFVQIAMRIRGDELVKDTSTFIQNRNGRFLRCHRRRLGLLHLKNSVPETQYSHDATHYADDEAAGCEEVVPKWVNCSDRDGRICQNNSSIGFRLKSASGIGRPCGPGSSLCGSRPRPLKMVAATSPGVTGRVFGA